MPASLLVSGIPQPLARWPNLDEADEGYRYFTGFSGRNSITDSALPANPNWAGGELVLRPIAWILDRLTIVSHTGNTLVTAEDSSYPIELGWGYFIQNHLAALDRNGEWVYNRNDKTITLQWPTDPNALVVEVPIRNTLIEIRNSQHVRFQDLELRGAQNNLLDVGGCSHLVLERLSMRFAGDRALLLNSCPNSQLTESTISDSMNNGLQLYACANCRVAHTQIERIGLVAGMGRNADGQYVGAETGGTAGNPAIFEHNTVSHIGYIAIDLRGPALTQFNVVSDWNRVKMDGAGIYTYRNADITITNNLVGGAYGSTAGTPWSSTGTHGIYIDDDSERITVSHNVSANISGAGVYLHNTRNVTVTNNLVFNVDEVGLLLIDDQLGTYGVDNSYIRENVVATRGVPMVEARSTQTNAFFNTLGLLNYNQYCDPFGEPVFRVELPSSGATLKTLAQWRSDHGLDLNSTKCADRYPTHLVSGPPGPDRVSNGTFNNDLASWFGWPDDTLDATWETGRLDGGSLLLGHNGPSPNLHFDNPIGAVQSGQTYRLQLSSIGITGAPTLSAYLRQAGEPYTRISNIAPVPTSPQRTEHEVFLDVTANQTDTLLIFEMGAPGKYVGLDNVVLQVVTATIQSMAEVTRFEANATAAPITITLTGYSYHGVDGTLYPAGSSITLQPNEAIVLLRREAVSGLSVFLPCIRR